MKANQQIATEVKPEPIWSPLAVGLFCFFFSFLAGGLMNAISYGRAGDPEKKKKRLQILIPAFIIFCVLVILAPNDLNMLFNMFNIATMFYFIYDQKKLFEEHTQRGGEKAGVGIPLLIALPILLILLFFVGIATIISVL
ncbi:hypothetical protein JOD24_000426 [Kroppenstedtia sanguinis]|uniref:DUF4234 domain-containing protein n=1 Tax=Kroppenstedtia sanguinis TaxID=1380684 RepID=A0ABW4C996_9BACL